MAKLTSRVSSASFRTSHCIRVTTAVWVKQVTSQGELPSVTKPAHLMPWLEYVTWVCNHIRLAAGSRKLGYKASEAAKAFLFRSSSRYLKRQSPTRVSPFCERNKSRHKVIILIPHPLHTHTRVRWSPAVFETEAKENVGNVDVRSSEVVFACCFARVS